MLPETAIIVSVTREGRSAVTLQTDREVSATPGQFLMLWLPGLDEKPFSIMSGSPLSVTVACVGPFSRRLHDLRPGDALRWRGPFGRGFQVDEARPLLLVGGGYGVAPLHFLAQMAKGRGQAVRTLVGAKAKEDLLLVERFLQLGCQVELATEDGSQGYHGIVTDLIKGRIGDEILCACGPEPMLVALASLCVREGLEGQFCLERYMKCGMGICGQCALGDRLVCADGPVFTAQDLARIKDFGKFRLDPTGMRVPIGSE